MSQEIVKATGSVVPKVITTGSRFDPGSFGVKFSFFVENIEFAEIGVVNFSQISSRATIRDINVRGEFTIAADDVQTSFGRSIKRSPALMSLLGLNPGMRVADLSNIDGTTITDTAAFAKKLLKANVSTVTIDIQPASECTTSVYLFQGVNIHWDDQMRLFYDEGLERRVQYNRSSGRFQTDDDGLILGENSWISRYLRSQDSRDFESITLEIVELLNEKENEKENKNENENENKNKNENGENK